jgi:CHAT domain-containing protein
LIDDYVLTVLPSASALPFIQKNARRSDISGQMSAVSAPLILGNDIPPLIFAEREAQAIADLYGVQPLLGEAATESAVWDRVSQASLLHLATHGGYNRYNPLYSDITLAPDGEDDGNLEVHEVYGLNLMNAKLVVLSACETHLGELDAEGEPVGVSSGDEVVGLTRAFFFAGTPTVIASLWSVEDEATALLMERFYTHLRDGMGKAEALRQAQLEVREQHPNPYYWAGFMLSGDGGEVGDVIAEAIPVSEKEEETKGGICLGLMLPSALAVAAFWRRRPIRT